MFELVKRKSHKNLCLLFVILLCTSCNYKTYQKSGSKPHWVSWSRGKIFKTKKRPSKNVTLNKELTYLFVIESTEDMPTYKREDVEDLVRLKAASYYANLLKANIEEFLLNEKNISSEEREVFLHKTNTLSYSIDISGLLPVAKYWEQVKNRKVIQHKVYFLYSVTQTRLESSMRELSDKIGLTQTLENNLIDKQQYLEEKNYEN